MSKKLLDLIKIGGCGFCIFLFFVFNIFTKNEDAYKVKKTERVCRSSNNCYYLVYTDKGVLKNSDSILNLKFNSSDMHSELDPGNVYNLKTVGIRAGVLSSYPNIIKIYKVKVNYE
jgi:hypothetical protein